MNNKQGPVLCILGFISLIPINVWAAQPLSEGALATQTGGSKCSFTCDYCESSRRC